MVETQAIKQYNIEAKRWVDNEEINLTPNDCALRLLLDGLTKLSCITEILLYCKYLQTSTEP
jgi:hypothetical protein